MVTQPGMARPQPHMYNVPQIRWSWLMTLGIMMLILGSLAIIFPAVTSVSVSLFLGILLLIGGVVRLIHMFRSRNWGDFVLRLIVGLLFLAAGVLLLARPAEGTLTLTLLLAIFFVAQGIASLIGSFVTRHQRGWGWLLLNGIVSLILGALIWAELPSSASWAIGLLLGVFLIFDGWAMIMLSWDIHHEEQTEQV